MSGYAKAIFGYIFLGMLLLTSCAYTTRSALSSHHKTIAVPVFINKTYNEGYARRLEIEVTEAARNAFIQVGELKLASRENADLILEGEVTKLEREIARIDRFGDPAETRLTIRARVSLYDVKEAKYLLKNQLVTNAEKHGESGVYNVRRGEYEAQAREKAVEDLGRMIARRVTDRWPTKEPVKP